MAASVEHFYRRFLFGAAALTFGAAGAELLLVEHYADRLQVLPFVMIGLGLLTTVWAWRAPSLRSIRAVRWTAGAVVLGSVAGIVLHAKGNVEFALEVTPNEPLASLIWDAVSGASPLLAPGMLALAAILAAAATYRHPALGR